MRIHMNRLRNIVGLIAVCATAAFFTGCGDDDNNDGNTNQPNAPASLAGRTYNLTDAAGTSTIAFDANGTAYALTPSGGGAAETGSFTATQSGETWNATITNAAGDRTSTVALTFTGNGTGTYTFTAPGEAPVSGNFSEQGGATDGNTTTTATDGNTTTTATDGNTTTGPGTVPAPANLQTITITPANGIAANQTFTVNLNGGNFTAVGAQGQDMGSGTYTYTPSGNTANLHLLYGGTSAGDFDDYNLVFTQQQGSGQLNNFTGTQQVSNGQSPINGTFSY
jgi:hypothetical protein